MAVNQKKEQTRWMKGKATTVSPPTATATKN